VRAAGRSVVQFSRVRYAERGGIAGDDDQPPDGRPVASLLTSGGCTGWVLYQLFDYGTDVGLRAVDVRDGRYEDSGEVIDVQLRSTTRAIVRDDVIAYDLDASTFEYLRRGPVSRPRILVLMVMPEAAGEWVDQDETELRLRRCAYWLSLRGAERSSATSSVRISIPRANVFDAVALTRLLDRRYRGEPI
jgi:hypothetical protein